MNTPARAARPSRHFAIKSIAKAVMCEPLEQRCHLSTTVTISTDRAQTIDGFGTSLGGQTPLTLIKTPKFQKAYYRDLGASMFRVALNPWTLKGTTANGKKSVGVPVYMGPHIEENIRQFDFDNFNIKKYGSFARGALKYGDDVKIIGSLWSPPFWMKGEEVSAFDGKPKGVMPTYNDKTGNTSGGSLIDSDDNLAQFGRYVAAYVKGFEKAYGVPLYAVSIQNELAFHEYYSSAVYSPDLYVKAVKAVDRWFNKYKIKTKILGPEDVGVGSTTNTGILSRQMSYIKALREDRDALRAVDIYAIHGYASDGVTPQRSAEMWGRYWNGQSGKSSYGNFDGISGDRKKSYMTELSGYSSSWYETMNFAAGVQDALVQGNVSGYVYWGISNSYDSGEALMTRDDTSANKYNAFKHFAKYVRPDSVRLQTSRPDPNGVYASAFVNDADRTLTSVLINTTSKDQDVRLKLDGISLSAFKTAFASTEAFTWKALRAYRVVDGQVRIKMPANSIFTLVGSTRKAPPDGSISGVYFNDANKNGRQDTTERGLGGDKIFIDLNANGTRDRREPTVVTNAKGGFAFTGLSGGTYRVRRELVSGYAMTTAPTATRLKKGSMTVTGLTLGVGQMSTKPPSSAPPSSTRLGSITGHAFADTNADGRQTGTEPDAVGKVIYLDANNNARVDSGEKQTKTDTDGDFRFTGLAAGTYRVRRVFPIGFASSTTPISLTLKTGETRSGNLIGSRAV